MAEKKQGDDCNGEQLFNKAMAHFGGIVEKNLQNPKIKSMKSEITKSVRRQTNFRSKWKKIYSNIRSYGRV